MVILLFVSTILVVWGGKIGLISFSAKASQEARLEAVCEICLFAVYVYI